MDNLILILLVIGGVYLLSRVRTLVIRIGFAAEGKDEIGEIQRAESNQHLPAQPEYQGWLLNRPRRGGRRRPDKSVTGPEHKGRGRKK